jgi:hypothetical protein
LSHREAALESALARWLAPRRGGAKLAALVGGPVRARLIGATRRAWDPYAAVAEVRHGALPIVVAGAARPVRALAQRLLGGPAELDAPRPLTVAEQAIWALAVAAAVTDLGLAAEVWPLAGGGGPPEAPADAPVDDAIAMELALELPAGLGGGAMTVVARFAPEVLVQAAPPRPLPGWRFDLPIVVGRCGLPRAAVRRLAVRDVITLERRLELVIGAGAIELSAAPGAVEARVATEYRARDMALPDEASLEITVQLGTTRMSLRQLGELAIGQIVPLGRPLAGPYEVRAAGRVVGQGELVDIDGELGVRIVSIADQPDQE